MKNNKGIAITFSTAVIMLNSDILMAADNTADSLLPPIWPLLALLIIIVVFRKQLNCNPPVDLDEKPAATSKAPIVAGKATTSAPKKVGTIDLKDGLNRCQASTSKGKRCKRETMLENTSISIDDKTYLLTVCSQHNTKKLKPYSELIK